MSAQVDHSISAERFKPFPADEEFEIKVPASIANLGPGFETLAVAVQLYVILRVKRIPGNGRLEFRPADARSVRESLIERAYRYIAGARGCQLPSLSVEVSSEIPVHAGLGGRAAATVAGLRLYEAVAGALPIQDLLQAACARVAIRIVRQQLFSAGSLELSVARRIGARHQVSLAGGARAGRADSVIAARLGPFTGRSCRVLSRGQTWCLICSESRFYCSRCAAATSHC